MIPPILLITDRQKCVLPLEETLRQALEAGCRWIMLREKDLPANEQVALAKRIKAMCNDFDAVLTVNGDKHAAALCDSIHVQNLEMIRNNRGKFSQIGFSAHSPEQGVAAAEAGASYVTLSPIFPSISKPDYNQALGLAALIQASIYSIPIVALGGITPDNAASCIEAGASAVAVMGCVMQSRHPGKVITSLLNTLPSP